MNCIKKINVIQKIKNIYIFIMIYFFAILLFKYNNYANNISTESYYVNEKAADNYNDENCSNRIYNELVSLKKNNFMNKSSEFNDYFDWLKVLTNGIFGSILTAFITFFGIKWQINNDNKKFYRPIITIEKITLNEYSNNDNIKFEIYDSNKTCTENTIYIHIKNIGEAPALDFQVVSNIRNVKVKPIDNNYSQSIIEKNQIVVYKMKSFNDGDNYLAIYYSGCYNKKQCDYIYINYNKFIQKISKYGLILFENKDMTTEYKRIDNIFLEALKEVKNNK